MTLENDLMETKQLSLFVIYFEDEAKDIAAKIHHLCTCDETISFVDDFIATFSEKIALKYLNEADMLGDINQFYDTSLKFLTTDEALENFDIKLSINIKKSIEKLQLKCMNNTKKMFMKSGRKISTTEDNKEEFENFIYDINDENSNTDYSCAVLIKEFSIVGISYLTFTKVNTDFTIGITTNAVKFLDEQISTLNEFIHEALNVRRSRAESTRTIPVTISLVSESQKRVMENSIIASPASKAQDFVKKNLLGIKKAHTFKELLQNTHKYADINTPNRSASTSKMKTGVSESISSPKLSRNESERTKATAQSHSPSKYRPRKSRRLVDSFDRIFGRANMIVSQQAVIIDFFYSGAAEEMDQSYFFKDIETWSEMVDPKVMKKMSKKEIRRQDIIYELIKTEHNYVRTLKTVHKVYYNGLLMQLKLSRDIVEKLLPKIIDLISVHGPFLANLMQAMLETDDNVIRNIGDALLCQFTGLMSKKMEEVYGFVCSNQTAANECYKRPVKYLLLIESIAKNTQETEEDFKLLKKSLESCKEMINNINKIVKFSENGKLLMTYKNKCDQRYEYTSRSGYKLKIADAINEKLELLLVTTARIKYKLKTFESTLLGFDKYLLLLWENNQKYHFVNAESKCPVLYYKDLMVRFVATDTRALYVVDKGNTEIYEISFTSDKLCLSWYKLFCEKEKNISNVDCISTERLSESKEPVDQYKEYIEEAGKIVNKMKNLHCVITSNLTVSIYC
ncbi:hypothetical protein HZS_4111 [Henneguya salminicola]|nr:hypothetical protein HZS_4111 [Henneguya salminicola]